MKAWEYAKHIVDSAEGTITIESDEDWTQSKSQIYEISKIRTMWLSKAPGSGAPACLIAGAIQSVENMGRDVTEAEEYFLKGQKAYSDNDNAALIKYTSKIFQALNYAPVDTDSDYWNYKQYKTWSQFVKASNFSKDIKIDKSKMEQQIYWGWLGQICAGSFGTALEGYARETIKRDFGKVEGYLKKPSPYNDDITFQIAFLLAMKEHGSKIKSSEIAEYWISLIPYAWSAEDIALKNLLLGVKPPYTGRLNNPYTEWIGAQMRGSVCGMVAPGQPMEAARLAWIDGQISHSSNGIIGEVFNAVLTALAFVESDVRKLVADTIEMLPADSQYYGVVKFALETCRKAKDAEEAFIICEEEYKKYNLVHAYPNAAIEVIALWFGEGDYDKTIYLVGLAGLDVDCNAGQVGNVVGILNAEKGLDPKWAEPMGEEYKTYVRNYDKVLLSELVDWTMQCIK
ncbi:MAG: ADP-ribosylglycohydrolase [Clostridia bacterium]|nr:ADP-ribosylglycohydrolase [Clostridia bacterium]